VADAPLITGGSGIAMGLPGNYRRRGLLSGGDVTFPGSRGPGVVISGSCSPMTRRQVEAFRSTNPSFAIDTDRLMAGADLVAEARDFARSWRAAAPLIFSSTDPQAVAAAQQRYGVELLAHRIEALFAQLAQGLVADGVERIVVAGGETSGAVVSALGVSRFAIGPEIAPGVPALAAANSPLRMALKSGNFGPPDFFARALTILAGGKP
jgi:3-dehydrotetronate 4-kinase